MKRSEKVTAVEQLNGVFSTNPHVLLTAFSGLGVNQATALRSKVRSAGGRFQVVKNRLAKRAAEGTPVSKLAESFTGPCAVATHDSDPVVLAKTLAEFRKDNPQLELIGGIVDAQDVLDAKGVKHLATLPGLPELRAQLLALIQTPASQLVRLLGTPGTQVTRALDARREDLEKQG